VSGPDPSTHRQAQGGEEDRTTMLRVIVRYSNHEAQTPRELSRAAPDRWYGVKRVDRKPFHTLYLQVTPLRRAVARKGVNNQQRICSSNPLS